MATVNFIFRINLILNKNYKMYLIDYRKFSIDNQKGIKWFDVFQSVNRICRYIIPSLKFVTLI